MQGDVHEKIRESVDRLYGARKKQSRRLCEHIPALTSVCDVMQPRSVKHRMREM